MKSRMKLARDIASDLSMRHRCHLLSVPRSSAYYQSKRQNVDDADFLNEIREIYERHPFKGYKRITDDLAEQGYVINHKRVYRLLKLMGLQAIYPKKNLSKRRQKDAVYPYLLKENPPMKSHDCWCVDITYIKTGRGFIYLTALIDVYSRCIMGWQVSPCLDTEGCIDALEMAVKSGYKAKIVNSDKGCQFTSQEWVYSLRLLDIKISMDGKGRYLDNISIERFWRTIKYEEVYLKTYDTVFEAKTALAKYIEWYNHERRHSSLGKRRPYEVMSGIEIRTKREQVNNMREHSLQIAA
jgi:putative transposase